MGTHWSIYFYYPNGKLCFRSYMKVCDDYEGCLELMYELIIDMFFYNEREKMEIYPSRETMEQFIKNTPISEEKYVDIIKQNKYDDGFPYNDGSYSIRFKNGRIDI
jgi:hypothetical protein